MEEREQQEIDLDKVYEYAEFPDKISGRCDNCNSAYFKSSVKVAFSYVNVANAV
ncbi:hypothetical protein F6Y04_07385 [Bacillus megaterium]|nr:hypothetical protein [Priestia megaterium]